MKTLKVMGGDILCFIGMISTVAFIVWGVMGIGRIMEYVFGTEALFGKGGKQIQPSEMTYLAYGMMPLILISVIVGWLYAWIESAQKRIEK
jgi:hypothetical protein